MPVSPSLNNNHNELTLVVLYNTDMRVSAAEIIIPEHGMGPPPHWHEMHDETFLVTKGTVRFHIPGKPSVDAHQGDYVVVPTRSPHTFSNIGKGDS